MTKDVIIALMVRAGKEARQQWYDYRPTISMEEAMMGVAYDAIRAAGLAVLPVDATDKMWLAGDDKRDEFEGGDPGGVWKAMAAAALKEIEG